MFIKFTLSVIFVASLVSVRPALAGTQKSSPFTGECSNLPLDHAKILTKAVFPVSLKPYGNVCFVAHVTKYPFPPDGTGLDYSTTTYLALSLYQNGKNIYDFTYPNTPPEDWPAAITDIQSVAFRKLKGTKYTDVIVIGVGPSANGPAVYRPLVFIATNEGFKLDEALTESDAIFDIGTMPALLKAIEKIGVTPAPQ